MRLRRLRGQRGFTMIEMIVVLIIIAVLVGVGIRFYTGYIENSRITRAKAELSVIQAALDSYYAENHKYPWGSTTEALTNALRNAGVLASDEQVASDEDISDGYAALTKTDPWGENYVYGVNDTSNPKIFVFYTSYDTVQGVEHQVVAVESKNGKVVRAPEVTTDTAADGEYGE